MFSSLVLCNILGIFLFLRTQAETGHPEINIMLTFVIPQGTRECFYQPIDLEKYTGKILFEFSVLDGGDRDIEVEVEDSDYNLHFGDGERREDGELNITVRNSGEIKICFSNEFSIFTSKQVYFQLEIPLKKIKHSSRDDIDSELIISLDKIEMDLDEISSQQTYLSRGEFRTKKLAIALNSSVMWTSMFLTFGLLVVTVGQVFVLKQFFREKTSFRPKQSAPASFPEAFSNGGPTQMRHTDTYGTFVVN